MQASQQPKNKPMPSSNRVTAMLTDEQKENLTDLAHLRGASMSQVIGDLIDQATTDNAEALKALQAIKRSQKGK